MKKTELKSLINECIHEVLAEETVSRKASAVKQIRNIINENQLEEADLEEIFGFGGKPVTDEEIVKYMSSHPTRKKIWAKASTDADVKAALIKFLKDNKNYVKNNEVLMNIDYDPKTKSIIKTKGGAGGGSWFSGLQ
jgi:hypothetical protein